MKYSFGIDLGTTNSCISVHTSTTSGESTKIIPLRDGRVTLPSCVEYRDGKVAVGQEAYKRRWDKDHVVYSVKRLMGTDSRIPLCGDSEEPIVVTPVEVSAEILKELKRNAEILYGAIQDVVITVPAYFGMEQRRDTKKAAELAGFNVLSLISEPTAAALAYGLDSQDKSDQILVYDLGGGTFDVSLLKFSKLSDTSFDALGLDFGDDESMVCKVISTSGDNHLGGDDLDNALAKVILDRLRKTCSDQYGSFPEEFVTDEMFERLILSAEVSKKNGADQFYQQTFMVPIDGEEKPVSVSWDSKDFKQALIPIFDKTVACIQQCLMSASDNHFSKIVLVGGSTKLQMLKDMLREVFPKVEILDTLNPDESVAIGASIKAAADQGETGTMVDDILPMPIGVETVNVYGTTSIGGQFTQILPKNAVLPVESSKSFATDEDNQEVIEVKIYQGTSPSVVNNTLLGTLRFDKIPKGKAGEVEIIVKFLVDANGLLTVKVKTLEGEEEVKLSNILNPVANQDTMLTKKIKRHLAMLSAITALDPEVKQRAEGVLQDAMRTGEVNEQVTGIMKFIADMYRKVSSTARQSVFANMSTALASSDGQAVVEAADDDELE